MFYDPHECVMGVLGTTKHSQCSCTDTWQYNCIVWYHVLQTTVRVFMTYVALFCKILGGGGGGGRRGRGEEGGVELNGSCSRDWWQ